jgi:hypothetical protein
MAIEGYTDYKRREFCNDVRCPCQVDLNARESGSAEYEKIRQACKENCRYTTYQFHHWLIGKGYEIVKPKWLMANGK